jgi:hypothetical protein
MDKFILAFVIILLGAGEAVAVDLINRDNRDYDVRVDSSFIFVRSQSQKSDICGSCTISLGNQSIRASGSDRVIIENGNLHKE